MISQLMPGTILQGRYRIVRLLGQGGMSTVYEAHDLSLNRRCVIKENLDTSPQAQQQFQQEAHMLAALRHPNLPQVIDVFEEGGKHYLVMEYIEGQSLEKILEGTGRPLPEPRVLAWAEQLCDVLAYLHAQNPPIMEDRFPSADAFWQALAGGAAPQPIPSVPVPRPIPIPVPQPVVVLGPRLSVDTTRLNFGDVRQGEKVTQKLRVQNVGGQKLQGEARSDVAWLCVQPETFSGNDQELTVSVETADLPLAKFQRPTPNVIRPLWNKIKGIDLSSAGCLLFILLITNLFWIPMVIFTLAAMLQGIIGLAYWHARRIVPAATRFQETVELETNGGNRIVGVEVTVMPRTTAVAGRWLAVLGVLLVELVIATSLIVAMANQ